MNIPTGSLCPGDNVPLEGVKTTPGSPLLADQLILPSEPETGAMTVVQVHPSLLPAQLTPAVKLSGSTVTIWF